MRVACVYFGKDAPASKIAEHFLRFSPQICTKKDEAIFIEIGKSKRLFKEESFLARAQVILRRFKLKGRITLGSDITDTLALAQYQRARIDDLPLQALQIFADPFERDPALAKQVQKMIDSFFHLGIRTLGDFKKIPVAELISRYGVTGRHCYQRVRQEAFISWPLWKPEEKITEIKQFPYFEFYGELDPILFELKTQLDQIFLRLRAREKSLTRLKVIITCEKSSEEPKPVKPFEFEFYSPQTQTKGTLRIIKERLMRYFEKDPVKSPIEQIETQVVGMMAFTGAQKNIFNNDEEKKEGLTALHNYLAELRGKNSLFQAKLLQDARPEKSFAKIFGGSHKQIETEDEELILESLRERPTYILPRPVKIEITAGYVYIKSKRFKILHWDCDVERISGGWYEKPDPKFTNTFERNYYHVELENNQKIFVFETRDQQYFMHGYFG